MAVIERLGRPPVWPSRLAPCLADAGRWRRVANKTHAQAAYLCAQYLRKQYGGPGWEFTTGETFEHGVWGVWARYLGPEASAA